MALLFKSTAFLPLLLVILLPNGGDSTDSSNFNFAFDFAKRSQALVEGNKFSQISILDSSGTVRNNTDASVNVAKAQLDVQDNDCCRLQFHGGSLHLSDSARSVVTGNDNDLDITECQDVNISGQQNKGTFRYSEHITFLGKDNHFDVARCERLTFSGERNKGSCKKSNHLNSNGNDNKLSISDCHHIDVTSSTNKMTIFVTDSWYVSIQDSSNSQVKMSHVKSIQVSGKDVTLEGTDIQNHAFLGKSCSGNNITHKLTVFPSKDCGLVTKYSSNRACEGKYWPISLQFCNAAIVSGPTYKVGDLPSLTIEIDEEKETAAINMTEGKAECKIIDSEVGGVKVSISALSEKLLIEGAKDIRRVDNGNCEFTLNLGKDAAQVSPSDSAGDGVISEDKGKNSFYKMLSPLFDVGKGAVNLAHSFLHNFI